MALKNFTQFTPQTVLSATDFVVGYRNVDEIRTDLDSLTVAISGLLIAKGFTPGGSVGTVKRINYRYTIDAGENLNAVSGMDDYGNYLSYTTGQLDVYRNGVHLVDNQDFIANNSTQILNLSTMNEGDVVDVVTLSATGVTIINLLTGGGTVFQSNYRYTCPTKVAQGTINISGPDDSGNTLLYSSPTLDVYLNGSHLVNGLDYSASNGSTITLSEGLSSGDILDVATLSAYDIGGLGGVSRIVAGPGIILNPSSGLGEVTITGNTLQLTGGNINIIVGSTRSIKTVQSAFDSLSGYLLNSTAVVTISCDPEVFTSSTTTNISHPNGDKISLVGTTQEFRCVTNPVVSVSGGFTTTSRVTGFSPLSATLAFDTGYDLPAVGDYILIQSASGRQAGILGGYATGADTTDAQGNLRFRYPPQYAYRIDENEINYATATYNQFAIPLTGAKVIISVLSAGKTNHLVRTIQSISGSEVVNYVQSPAIKFVEASVPAFNNLQVSNGQHIIVMIGNPQSYRGTTFTQVPSSVNVLSSLKTPDNLTAMPFDMIEPAVLRFSDTGVATSSYLNPGDWIYAIGQTRQVVALSSNNTCVIDRVFWEGGNPLSGRNSTITTPTPFLIKTHYERYMGLHKVVQVAGSNVTIETGASYNPNGTYNSYAQSIPAFQPPLPIYGVNVLAAPVSAGPVGISSGWGQILKTKLQYTGTDTNVLIADTSISSIKYILFDKPGIGGSIATNNFATRNCNLVTFDTCGFSGQYTNLLNNPSSTIALIYCGFTSFISCNTSTLDVPTGAVNNIFGIRGNSSKLTSLNSCYFRGINNALGYGVCSYSVFSDGNILNATGEGSVINFSHILLFGQGTGGPSESGIIFNGNSNSINTANRYYHTRTSSSTYGIVRPKTSSSDQYFGNGTFSYVGESSVGSMWGGIYGLSVSDGENLQIVNSYFIGGTIGLYFYGSNTVSDVAFRSWGFALHEVAISSASNVSMQNRQGGSIINCNNIVSMGESGASSQRMRLTVYTKTGNTSVNNSTVVDGAPVSSNDNFLRVI